MKKLLLISLILTFSSLIFAQSSVRITTEAPYFQGNIKVKDTLGVAVFKLNNDTITNMQTFVQSYGGGGDTTSLSNRIDLKLDITDTVGFLRSFTETDPIYATDSAKILWFSDTTLTLATKNDIAGIVPIDTTYLRTDINTNTANILLKADSADNATRTFVTSQGYINFTDTTLIIATKNDIAGIVPIDTTNISDSLRLAWLEIDTLNISTVDTSLIPFLATSNEFTKVNTFTDIYTNSVDIQTDLTKGGNILLSSEGTGNIFLGEGAGNLNTTGIYNVYLGYNSANKSLSSGYNVAIGALALNNYISTSATSGNLAIGASTGFSNQTGLSNIFLGNGAGYYDNGGYGIYIGNYAGRYNISNVTINKNTIIGYNAGYGVVGSTAYRYNLFIGYKAGYSTTTGSSNIVIGTETNLPTPTTNNYLSIGDLITGTLTGTKTISLDGTTTIEENVKYNNDAIVVSTTLSTSNKHYILVYANSGNVVISLPDADTYLGTEWQIKRIDETANTVTIDLVDATDKIDGDIDGSFTLNSYDSYTMYAITGVWTKN